MSKTFDDIAIEQGWNADSRETVLRDFIDTHPGVTSPNALAAYAQKRADEENDDGTTPTPVPDFSKEITGEAFGGAYWNPVDYRLIVKVSTWQEHMGKTVPDKFLLTVEDTTGHVVLEHEFTDEQAEALRRLVHTSEEADDDGLGLSRELHWRVRDMYNQVDLDLNILSEIDAWLDFVFGDEEWTGGSEWEW